MSSSNTPLLTSSTSSSSSSSTSEKNVLFACTTFKKGSTLSDNFVKINKLVRTDLEQNELINTYFVYKINEVEPILIENTPFEKTLNNLRDNKYFIAQYPININFVDFLKQNPNLKFDKIVLTQCNEIITIIIGDFLYNITFENNIFQEIYDNLHYMNDSLKDNGIIINYHYGINGELSLSSFSNTLAPITLKNFPYVLFILILIDKFFEETSIGIYHKKSNVNVDSINIEEIIDTLTEHFNKTNDYKTIEEYEKFIIDSLTTFSTIEKNFFIMNYLFNKYYKNLKVLNDYRKNWEKILSPDEQPSSFKI